MGPNLTQVVEDNSEPIGIPGYGQASHFCPGCSCFPVITADPLPPPSAQKLNTKDKAMSHCQMSSESQNLKHMTRMEYEICLSSSPESPSIRISPPKYLWPFVICSFFSHHSYQERIKKRPSQIT